MKLLDSYKAHIEALCENDQRITKAWFTTFNLNLDFFERYLVSPLVGHEPPRNALDYEHLQAALLSGGSGTGIDLHCFCDQQIFDVSQPKRTSLPVHLVTPAALGRPDAIFHPKVIYLENSAGEAVLGVGSANLTVSGWAHNHEVFSFERVASLQQRDAVTGFFSKIAEACQLDTVTFVSGVKLQAGASSDWVFFHNFSQQQPFLTYFLRDTQSDLWVLSPYFSTDLGSLLALIRQHGIKHIHVVPDLKSDGTIRTTYSEALQQCLQDKSLGFYALPDELRRQGEQPGEEAMRHAKLWMTNTRLAVGSWNMTRPGTGTAGVDENNVEAGFIYSLPSPSPLVANLLEMDASRFMQAAALKEEAPVAAGKPTFPYLVNVVFDWNRHSYRVSVLPLHKKDIPPANTFSLLLPDIKDPQMLEAGKEIPLLRSARELCRQRMFVIKDEQGVVCYTGLILEERLEHRRGQGFANIYDLLAAVLSGDPVNHGNGRMAITDIQRSRQVDDTVDDDAATFLPDTYNTQLGYFPLFQLFASYHEQVNKLVQNSNADTWKRLLWSQPGSVMELAEKLRELFEGDAGYSDVFRWFAAQEMLFLLERMQTHCEEWDAKRVEENLLLPIPTLSDDGSQNDARRQYLAYITVEIRKSIVTGEQIP